VVAECLGTANEGLETGETKNSAEPGNVVMVECRGAETVHVFMGLGGSGCPLRRWRSRRAFRHRGFWIVGFLPMSILRISCCCRWRLEAGVVFRLPRSAVIVVAHESDQPVSGYAL
jgi:hypothetical protein